MNSLPRTFYCYRLLNPIRRMKRSSRKASTRSSGSVWERICRRRIKTESGISRRSGMQRSLRQRLKRPTSSTLRLTPTTTPTARRSLGVARSASFTSTGCQSPTTTGGWLVFDKQNTGLIRKHHFNQTASYFWVVKDNHEMNGANSRILIN